MPDIFHLQEYRDSKVKGQTEIQCSDYECRLQWDEQYDFVWHSHWSEHLAYYSKQLLFNSCVFRSLQLPPKEPRRISLRLESRPPVQRLCMWVGMSLRSQMASLKSTSSGRSGKVSSTLAPLTRGSIRSQVKKKKYKRKTYRKSLSLWLGGQSLPGVGVWYMRSLREDVFSWHMVRSPLSMLIEEPTQAAISRNSR